MTIHAEAASAPVRTLRAIRAAGARAGLAFNPGTPVLWHADLLPEIDMLLLMTVEPGFGGQQFLDLVLPKIRRARELISAYGGEVWLIRRRRSATLNCASTPTFVRGARRISSIRLRR